MHRPLQRPFASCAAVLTASMLFIAALGCGSSPPAASISAPRATPEMNAATKWLIGAWSGKVEINRDAVLRSEGLTDAHVASIEAAKMQFRFQDNGKVAIAASIPTAQGPAARNAMGDWVVLGVDGSRVKLRTTQKDSHTEEVIITRVSEDQFVMPAPQEFGIVRFQRVR